MDWPSHPNSPYYQGTSRSPGLTLSAMPFHPISPLPLEHADGYLELDPPMAGTMFVSPAASDTEETAMAMDLPVFHTWTQLTENIAGVAERDPNVSNKAEDTGALLDFDEVTETSPTLHKPKQSHVPLNYARGSLDFGQPCMSGYSGTLVDHHQSAISKCHSSPFHCNPGVPSAAIEIQDASKDIEKVLAMNITSDYAQDFSGTFNLLKLNPSRENHEQTVKMDTSWWLSQIYETTHLRQPTGPGYPDVTIEPQSMMKIDTPVMEVTPPPAAAARLIGRLKAGYRRKQAIPWGMQRIVTHKFIEKEAAKIGIPVPHVYDADIQAYFDAQARVPKDPIKSVFPPINVDIRLLGSIGLTAEEFFSFFSNHYKWNDGVYRFAQNGWKTTDMSGYINYARQLSLPDIVKSNSLLKCLQAADKAILGLTGTGKSGRKTFKTTRFSADRWIPPKTVSEDLIDYFLVDLADGVVNWPEGDGARLLTRAVRFAKDNDFRYVKLSETGEFIRKNLLCCLPLVSMRRKDGQNSDTVAKNRVHGILERDRKRVKASNSTATIIRL